MCQRANVASRCASSAVIMDSTPSWLVTGATASAALVAAAILRYLLSTRRPKGFPPGPPTLLGVGNLHQIPIERPFIKFHEWAETYGDIIGLKVGPANLVVLHDPQYVRELLDRRGAIYSGRPYSYIPSEHVFAEHGDKHILNLQNGPYLRRWRSAVAYLVGPAGLKQTLPMQEATSATLVKKLLQTPSDFPDHIKNWALATPLLVITGQKLDDREKGFLDRFFNAQKKWLELLEPGNAPPVDIFPFLRWVPFADWKKKAKYVRDYMLEEYEGFFQTAKALSSDIGGEAPASQSLMTKIIEDQDKDVKPANRFTHDEIAFMGGGLLDAAVDTTWSTILSFIMFMATYPDMQAKVQKEIDSVSPGQPPGGDIIDRLPYTRACLFEVNCCSPNNGPLALSNKPRHRYSAFAHRRQMACPTSSTATTLSMATRYQRVPPCLPMSGVYSSGKRTTTSRRSSSPRDTWRIRPASGTALTLLRARGRLTPSARGEGSARGSSSPRTPSSWQLPSCSGLLTSSSRSHWIPVLRRRSTLGWCLVRTHSRLIS